MNLLNLEDEKFKTITVKGKKFKIKIMTPLDRVQIAQQRMRLQGGNPISALTEDDFMFFENIAINNICIDELPAGFQEHESSIKWDDIYLINQVAHEIIDFTLEFETRLKKNRPDNGGEQA